MGFASPKYLVLVALLVPLLWLRRKRPSQIGHSQVALLKQLHSVPLIGRLPILLLALAVFCICAAFAEPNLPHLMQQQTIHAIDLIFGVDISGSMAMTLRDPDQQKFVATGGTSAGTTGSGATPKKEEPDPRRIDAAKKSIKMFLLSRKGDRIGLLTFDTDTYWLWPLTNSLEIITDNVELIGECTGGTNFEGPTKSNPGMGPLQSAIDHFKKYGQSKTRVFVMVTDGDDRIAQARMNELESQMKALKIRLYVLAVGESWSNSSPPDLQVLTQRMNGLVIHVGNARQMREAIDRINRLEKSTVSLDKKLTSKPIYQAVLAAALVLLLLYHIAAFFMRERA